MTSPYLNRPLRSEAQARRDLGLPALEPAGWAGAALQTLRYAGLACAAVILCLLLAACDTLERGTWEHGYTPTGEPAPRTVHDCGQYHRSPGFRDWRDADQQRRDDNRHRPRYQSGRNGWIGNRLAFSCIRYPWRPDAFYCAPEAGA